MFALIDRPPDSTRHTSHDTAVRTAASKNIDSGNTADEETERNTTSGDHTAVNSVTTDVKQVSTQIKQLHVSFDDPVASTVHDSKLAESPLNRYFTI